MKQLSLLKEKQKLKKIIKKVETQKHVNLLRACLQTAYITQITNKLID